MKYIIIVLFCCLIYSAKGQDCKVIPAYDSLLQWIHPKIDTLKDSEFQLFVPRKITPIKHTYKRKVGKKIPALNSLNKRFWNDSLRLLTDSLIRTGRIYVDGVTGQIKLKQDSVRTSEVDNISVKGKNWLKAPSLNYNDNTVLLTDSLINDGHIRTGNVHRIILKQDTIRHKVVLVMKDSSVTIDLIEVGRNIYFIILSREDFISTKNKDDTFGDVNPNDYYLGGHK